MVRSAGGKRVTGRDMTKSLVKAHVAGQTARHGSPLTSASKQNVAGANRGAASKKATRGVKG